MHGMGISVLICCLYSRPFFQCLWLLILLHLRIYYHAFYDISRHLLNQEGAPCLCAEDRRDQVEWLRVPGQGCLEPAVPWREGSGAQPCSFG